LQTHQCQASGFQVAPGSARRPARFQLVAQNGDLLELCIRKLRENAENSESERVFVLAKKWNSVGLRRPTVGCVWDSEIMAGEDFSVTSVNEALRDVIEMPQVGYHMTILSCNHASARLIMAWQAQFNGQRTLHHQFFFD